MPDYVSESGCDKGVGLIAQQLKETIPDAVVESGDIKLENGEIVKNLLHVDKNRVYMECVGAVIELGKKTGNLDNRIEKLEQQIVASSDIDTNESKPNFDDNNTDTKFRKASFSLHNGQSIYIDIPFNRKIENSKQLNLSNEKSYSSFLHDTWANLKLRCLIIFILLAIATG
jgi:hypothetical protein